MKKPEYIEIRLPGRKSTFSMATKRYFKRLEAKVLEVNFGREREKKIFNYLVYESSFRQGWSYWHKTEKPHWVLKLSLRVPKEDLDKVL